MNSIDTATAEIGRGRRFARLVDAHCQIAAAPPAGDDIGFLLSTLVRFTLPHRQCRSHMFERCDGDRLMTFMAPPSIGLPCGMWPRLLLIYLTTRAVRTRNREVDLGASLSAFMKALGCTITGGRTGSIRAFKEQLLRTASLTSTVSHLTDQQAQFENVPVADSFDISWIVVGTNSRSGLPARIRLGERVFDQMRQSAVPLDMRAVRAIRQSPLAFDLYAWLTFRAPRLAATHVTRISWIELRAQFGAGYATQSDFTIAFRSALAQVQMVYPALRCDATGSHFLLRKSAPSVPRKAAMPS